MEVQFGEGGKDSKLFVGDLFAAYARYAIANKLKIEKLYDGDGYISAKITGRNSWNLFENEAGKHCVQRIPPTESKGRRHTSIITVAVIKMDLDLPLINLSDIEFKTQGGHGKGGQHQNKTDSAVRAKHKVTKIEVFINGRSQHQNKQNALRILTAKVNNHYDKKRRERVRQDIQKHRGGGGRGNKIRTYNFIASRVVDHRSGLKTRQIEKIMKGRFDLLK